MPSTRSKALALAFFTVAYNLVEGGVAMLGAALSGSNALLGFGLDSLVEALSGMVMVWRFWKFDPAADDDEFEQVERKAARLVGYSFFNLRMLEEIDADSTNRDLRDRTAELQLEIEASDRGRNEIIDIAVKAFELSQSLREKWFDADYAAKRQILEILCLNCSLDGVSLVATMRNPFDLLAKGLCLKDSRDDSRIFERVRQILGEFSGCYLNHVESRLVGPKSEEVLDRRFPVSAY